MPRGGGPIGAVMCEVTKQVSKIIMTLVGHSLYHFRNMQECMTSYDVKALFTSFPVDSAMSIIRHRF